MKAPLEAGLYTKYFVGHTEIIPTSHLQFANETLLLASKSWANVRAMKVVLILFESILGLKVNFIKSMLVGVNVADSWVIEAASV